MEKEFKIDREDQLKVACIAAKLPTAYSSITFIVPDDGFPFKKRLLSEQERGIMEEIGRKYGFDPYTITWVHSHIVRASPQSNVEKKMSEFDTLKRIVEQLEACDYENEAGPLVNNIAFMKLKQLSEKEGSND